jgi:hypothetical protein
LQLGQSLSSPDDASAITQAGELAREGPAAELWQGGRLVGRFSKHGVFAAAPEAGGRSAGPDIPRP